MAAFRRFEALREAVFTVVIPAILRVQSLGWKAERTGLSLHSLRREAHVRFIATRILSRLGLEAERFEKDEGLREVVQTGRDVW